MPKNIAPKKNRNTCKTTMKICHINLAKGFRGGERQTLLLIEALAKRNIKQQAVVRYDSPLINYLSEVECDLITLRKPYWLNLFFKKIDADLVHAHEAKAAQLALLNYHFKKIPYCITRRVPNLPKQNFFNRNIYQSAAKVIALSSAIKQSLKHLMDNHSVAIIPSMFASLTSDVEKVRTIKNRYADKFIVGHIGALVNKHKGQFYLIEAARQLQQSCPQIQFILLGSGYDEQQLKQQAKGLKNIEFTGFVTDVGSYLQSFDLFAFPSLQEGLGSILLDAMQAELPIVGSDVDGIPDIIQHNENGLLVPPADSAALAKAIMTLYNDADLRCRLVQSAKQRLSDYSPANIADDYLNIYQSLLSHRPYGNRAEPP